MDKSMIVNMLRLDESLLQDVMMELKDKISVEVAKDRCNEWDVEVCNVDDVIISDNEGIILSVEAFL